MGNIAAIKPVGIQPVYNMTVEKHHNYLIAGNIILKNCDALRYGLIYRTMGARLEPVKPEPDDDMVEEYDDYMTGGDATDGYLSYGG